MEYLDALIWFEGSGCDCLLMQAASLFNGLSFDGFPPFEYSRSYTEVDVGRLVVAAVFVVLDELADALFKLSWQIVIFQRIRFFIE